MNTQSVKSSFLSELIKVIRRIDVPRPVGREAHELFTAKYAKIAKEFI